MEETQKRWPLYIGGAAVAAYLWKRKRGDDEELKTESGASKLIPLIFICVLAYSFKEHLGEITRAVGPLVASNLILKSGKGYIAASIVAIIVYLGVTPALLKI